VADPEVAAMMTTRLAPLLVGALLLAALLPSSLVGAAPLHPLALSSTGPGPVKGNVSGPTLLATNGTGTYYINGSGGPAFLVNGTKVGNLTFYASVTGPNTTGVAISPSSAALTGAPFREILSVAGAAQTLTIHVMISSVYLQQNESINLSYLVNVVRPYVVLATIVAGTSSTVLSFPVQISLDGRPVGVVTVPTLQPRQEYNISFRYATLGLSPGEHTFSISLVAEHGLVVFANGATVYSATFYVEGPAPDYTLWYLAGAVAFFGVLFIFAARVGARRRGALRK
jgi:hypothetical protein